MSDLMAVDAKIFTEGRDEEAATNRPPQDVNACIEFGIRTKRNLPWKILSAAVNIPQYMG